MRTVYESAIIRLIGDYYTGCCVSCHEDADQFGYTLIALELGKDREAEVCCAVARAYEEYKVAK